MFRNVLVYLLVFAGNKQAVYLWTATMYTPVFKNTAHNKLWLRLVGLFSRLALWYGIVEFNVPLDTV